MDTSHKKHFLFLLFASFFLSCSTYSITPVIALYLIEPFTSGGLGWSQDAAFAVVGTFLATNYIAPFFGGLVADYKLGRKKTASIGYALAFLGALGTSFFTSNFAISFALLSFAVGSGWGKVCLNAHVGALCANDKERNIRYDKNYVASGGGFLIGTLCGGILFQYYSMHHLLFFAAGLIICSSIAAFFCFSPYLETSRKSVEEPTHDSAQNNALLPYALLLLLSILFFLSSNQINALLPLFLQNKIDRSIGSLIIPTIWFNSFGAIVMICTSSLRLRAYKKMDSSSPFPEFFKLGIGFLLSFISFAMLFLLYQYDALTLSFLLLIHALLFIGDAHVRPVLFAASSKYVDKRFRTIATASVSTSIGIGGKIAGSFAGLITVLDYGPSFFLCALSAILGTVLCFSLWRYAMPAFQGRSFEQIEDGKTL